MADKVLCDKSDLVNIADAVRSKLGVTDTYYVSELSSAIQNIQTGGGGGGSVGAVPLCSGSVQVLPDGNNGVNFGDVYDIFSAYESYMVMFVIVARNLSGNATSIRAYYRYNFELVPASDVISIGADIDLVNSSLEDLTVSYPAPGKMSIYCVRDLCI